MMSFSVARQVNICTFLAVIITGVRLNDGDRRVDAHKPSFRATAENMLHQMLPWFQELSKGLFIRRLKTCVVHVLIWYNLTQGRSKLRLVELCIYKVDNFWFGPRYLSR